MSIQDAGARRVRLRSDATDGALAGPPRRSAAVTRTGEDDPIIGRVRELAALTRLVDGLADRGQAALVSGDAGAGKTTLLGAVAAHARARGCRELRCTGVPSETTVGFGGLHELLQPVLDQTGALPRRQREALLTAFGLASGPAPDRLVLSLAVLGLLEEVAHRQPLVVVVDDVQWVDRSSREIIAFVSRRLSNAPLLLLAGIRSDGQIPDHRLPAHVHRVHLGPLSTRESEELLATLPDDLTPDARHRVVQEAAGNPLALREFASAVGATGDGPAAPGPRALPTTRRLEDAFLVEVTALPASSQQFLLLVAAAEAEPLAELVPAGRRLGLTPADLDPAEAAGLITVTGDRVHFRHPLLRSAVYGAAGWSDRTRVHRMLASTSQDADRAAWHRSAMTVHFDEAVAADLTAAAVRSLRRGARSEAAAALERAAELSPDADGRSRRLSAAASCARQAGRAARAHHLVARALPDATSADVLSQLSSTQVMLSVTAGIPAPSPDEAIALTQRMVGASGSEHEQERAQVLLGTAAEGWLRGLPPGPRDRLVAELQTLDGDGAPLARLGRALLDPVGSAPAVRPDLPGLLAGVPGYAIDDGVERHPGSTQLVLALARASEALQDLPTAMACWDLGSTFFQGTAGALADEAQVLTGRAALRVVTGRPADALADADQALRMSQELGLPVLAGLAAAAAACAQVWLSPSAASASITTAKTLAGSAPPALTTALISWAEGTRALVERRAADAWTELRAVSVHPTTALWALGDIAEAGAVSDHGEEARQIVMEAEQAAAVLGSAHLSMLVLRSRAVLSDGAEADDLFEAAEVVGRDAGAPLELARTWLAHGQWLRRHGRVVAARELLVQALRAFGEADAHGWAERAAVELRAAGVTPGPLSPSSGTRLTTQELQIARMAAAGLTNKEIADRLYLSHRTVGAHLYRIYPKLGVTSRVQLRDALAPGE